jgi:hypothetical protein
MQSIMRSSEGEPAVDVDFAGLWVGSVMHANRRYSPKTTSLCNEVSFATASVE